jgi:hypothetical protein
LVPSERVIVPRSLATALPDAISAPVAVTGGHAPAHAPVQLEASPVSLTHRYTARPDPLTRNVPAEDVAVVITVLLDAAVLLGAAAADELAGAVVAVLLLPLLHAATSIATPTVPPTPAASLAEADIRLAIEVLIVLVSHPVRPVKAGPLRNDCRQGYERGPALD